jgi:hypothetical protein
MTQVSRKEIITGPRTFSALSFSDVEIEKSFASIDMGTWVPSMVEGVLKNARLGPSDFLGGDQSTISVDSLSLSMIYYAFKIGRSGGDVQWENECYRDFFKREKTFERTLVSIESACTSTGLRKLSAMKKEIRSRVESREISTKPPLESLGVFVEAPDMAQVLSTRAPGDFIRSLQLLGNSPQDDPRYYIHMIFRHHMLDLHEVLADDRKVMKFPTLQKWMDVTTPVSSRGNLPPEFREFLRKIGGSHWDVDTLPVPSKTEMNAVVYGYQFETTRWVQVMRQEMFKAFSEWKGSTSTAYSAIYPEALVLGDPRNKVITDVLAKSMEMTGLKQAYDFMVETSVNLTLFMDVITEIPESATLFSKYKSRVFETPGEQLRERRGFFMNSLVRKVFQRILKRFPTFCGDSYDTLSISQETMSEFEEYCRSKSLKRYSADDEKLWRSFLLSVEKICRALYVCSRVSDVEKFYAQYGTPDSFVRKIFERAW